MMTEKGSLNIGQKVSLLGVALFTCAIPSDSFAADEKPALCPYAEGQIIQPLSIREVYQSVNPDALKKGEFETTSAFEDRKEQSRKLSRFPFPVLSNMNSLYRNRYIQYDADKRVVFIDILVVRLIKLRS